MKKIITVLLALTIALGMVGCGIESATTSVENIWTDGVSFIDLTPGNETIHSEKIEIISDNAKVKYHLTYGAQDLTLTFGLRDADGTEYCREIVGGSDVGVIENLPAGNYVLFVRNSGDFSKYPPNLDEAVSCDATGAINYSIQGDYITFSMNFAGNYSLQQDMTLTNETPYWAITVNNEGSEDIVVEINGAVYRIPGGNAKIISTEEKWEPGTYSVSFSGAGASQMIGNAICVLSHRPSGN